MSVIGTIGNWAFPNLIKDTKKEETANKGGMGRSMLSGMFPNLYQPNVKQRNATNVKSKSKTEITNSVDTLAEQVVQSNQLISVSIEMQKAQNALLVQILNGIKSGGGPGAGGSIVDDILDNMPDLRRRTLGGGKGAGGRGAAPIEEERVKPKPNDRYKYNEKTQRWHDTANKNRMVSAAEATGAKVEQKAAQTAEKKFSMASIQKFIKYIALKKGKEYALKIGAKLTLAAGAAVTGVGAIFDLFFIALNVYDAYEVYQLWQEFSAAGEPNVPDAEKQGKDTTTLLDGNQSNGSVVISADGSKTISGEIIQFTGKDIIFGARELTISTKDIVVNGAADIGNKENPIISPTKFESGTSTPSPSDPSQASNLQTFSNKPADHVTGLQSTFSVPLYKMLQEAHSSGNEIRINSGFRTPERQAELFKAAVSKYGSEAAARKWVAPPGRSNHNKGLAADLGFGSEKAKAWAHANAGKFGLYFRMGYEPWHIENMRAYASGTNYVPTSGPAIVGEKGSELVIGKNGMRLTPNESSIMNLNQGDKVIPNDRVRKRTPDFPHVERSGSYISRPRYFDSAEQMYAAAGDRPAGNITDKQDRESSEVIAAFQRGEKPPKPDSMTDREYMNRMKDYGASAMLKGAITPEELQKATKQADQPMWQNKAQNITAAMVKNSEVVRDPSGAKIQVKPIVPPSLPPETDVSSYSQMDNVPAPAQTNAADFSRMDYMEQSDPEVANDLTGKMGKMSDYSSANLLKTYVNYD
jgi:hypothetical protein